MERLRQFIYGIIAGVCIAIGGTVFLSSENSVVGAFLFSIGLLSILFFRFQLYTGKIGYIVVNKPSYVIELILTWTGNFAGTFLAAVLIRNTRIFDKLEKVYAVAEIKLNDDILSIFILSVFCGILMFIAVDIFNNAKEGAVKIIGVLFPVVVFILSGFEHCVANMFYFCLAGLFNINALFCIIIMTFGNSLGGIVIPLSKKILSQENTDYSNSQNF